MRAARSAAVTPGAATTSIESTSRPSPKHLRADVDVERRQAGAEEVVGLAEGEDADDLHLGLVPLASSTVVRSPTVKPESSAVPRSMATSPSPSGARPLSSVTGRSASSWPQDTPMNGAPVVVSGSPSRSTSWA